MAENKENIFKNFINKYQVAKTLRFALEPVGETAEKLKQGFILKQDKEELKGKSYLQRDEIRAEQYKIVKKLIDVIHSDLIKKVLSKEVIKISKKVIF